MKKIIFLLLILAVSVYSQNHPQAGKTYKIIYNPSEKDIFPQNAQIKVVYAFDYWSTKGIANEGPEALFGNVLSPDPGRSFEQSMVNKIKYYEASISIPDSVSLLSYYFTDGKISDYNDKSTYIEYIYNEKGKPVKGARFRSIDFMVMSGKSLDKQIEVLKKEIGDYPEYHIARVAYWQKMFQNSHDFNRMKNLRTEFGQQFEELNKLYPHSYELLNAEGKIYNAYIRAVQMLMYDEYKTSLDKIIEICEKIPEANRSTLLTKIYNSYLSRKSSEKFTDDIIGKPAPEFEFTDINGETKKLSDFRGKTILLDFWGTWCGPCVAEIPNLKEAYSKFKNKGFEIISISSDLIMNDKNSNEITDFINKKQMTWTNVLDSKDKRIHKLYKITHWPTLFLVDANGMIIKNEKELRGSQLDVTLLKILNK